uniref:Oxidation resistance protein 1 n=1 Tax=Heterorhabditis bacteriophora TaxID=37862 RepID=A0A1I7XM41_HETBA
MGHAPSSELYGEDGLSRRRAMTSKSTTLPSFAPRLSCPDYMTQYDVKQLMHSYDIVKKRNSDIGQTTTPVESDGEELLEQFHKQMFGKVKQDNSQPKTSLQSNRSDRSDDSGVCTSISPPLSFENLYILHPNQAAEMLTPIACTPATPTLRDLSKEFTVSFRTEKRFFPKHRQRSQSLSADAKLISPDHSASRSHRLFDQLDFWISVLSLCIVEDSNNVRVGEKPAPIFGSSLLNREWEVVTVREMCRRLSLDEVDQIELPIPEGASASQVLDEFMIRQIMEILPPRAEGYPWVSIYNSEKHGFSLTTLYRKMVEFDEDLSPVLLVLRDTREHVFGAVVSGAIRPADHYSGTGDSCLLWRFTGEAPHTRELRHYTWTGDNQFFVNAAKDSLSIGAGGGHYGLWLDADLNHGRSQRCDTFDNEPLTGEKEDFVVQFIEAYGFRM